MSKKHKKAPIPVYSHPIMETHCHLDYLEQSQDLNEIIKEAEQHSIQRIITIAVSPDNLDSVLRISTQHPIVWGTQGIHPHEAKQYTSDVDAHIRRNAMHERIVAIGEIGLDYYYNQSPEAKQKQTFESQLQIAHELNLPIVVHTRDANEDTMAILKNVQNHLPRKGVIHSFTSGIKLAEFCLQSGFHLGFNGISTFNKAENVRQVMEATPLDRILLETDAPYLTPTPYRGQVNAPKYLPFIAEQVSKTKNIELSEVLKQCWLNSLGLFFPQESSSQMSTQSI